MVRRHGLSLNFFFGFEKLNSAAMRSFTKNIEACFTTLPRKPTCFPKSCSANIIVLKHFLIKGASNIKPRFGHFLDFRDT